MTENLHITKQKEEEENWNIEEELEGEEAAVDLHCQSLLKWEKNTRLTFKSLAEEGKV